MNDLPKFDTDDVPDGWSRNASAEDTLGATAIFDHDSDRWRIVVRRYDPGIADGKRVCREQPEDSDPLVAPLFETRLRSTVREIEDYLRIQTEEMDKADTIPLDGRETRVFPDPTGETVLAYLKAHDRKRQEIEDADRELHEELAKRTD